MTDPIYPIGPTCCLFIYVYTADTSVSHSLAYGILFPPSTFRPTRNSKVEIKHTNFHFSSKKVTLKSRKVEVFDLTIVKKLSTFRPKKAKVEKLKSRKVEKLKS